MTERDELISAYLDGEATADERARVEADPSMLAEVDRMRALTGRTVAIDDPGVADPFTRRRHLGAALAAFDELQADAGAAPEIDLRRPSTAAATSQSSDEGASSGDDRSDESALVADVVAMARPDRRRRPLGALVAAAAGVVMLVGVAVPLANRSGEDSGVETASIGDAADDSTDGARSMEASAVESEEMESFAADDEAMTDEAMEAEEAAADVAEEAMEEEASEEEVVVEEAGEVSGDDTAATESTQAVPEPEPLVVDPERRLELDEEMVARWENDVVSSEPSCPFLDGRVTLHVAPGRSEDSTIVYEIHLHADDAGGTGIETTLFTLPDCSPA